MDVRAATLLDVPAMLDAMFTAPSRDLRAAFRTIDGARRFQQALFERALASAATSVFVADDAGSVVGFALVSDGDDSPQSLQLVSLAVRSMGIAGAVTAAWRSRARAGVEFPALPGELLLSELQVVPTRRGEGIGGHLLEAVDAHARATGAGQVALTTSSTNVARRLYERHGYVLDGEKLDARYERLTGVPGRIHMVKRLG